jgi:hypothetical protein
MKLPSHIKYVNGFITMLVLLEKNTNNTPVFLKDINTLSKGRFIKIGLIISLSSELIEQYINMCLIHSIPKISNDSITFNMPIKNYNIFYNTNIILSNTVFSFDNELVQYYTYLAEFVYNIDFTFYTNTKNLFINKFLISLYNLNILNENKETKNIYNDVTETNVMLEIGDEDYSELEDETEDLEKINLILKYSELGEIPEHVLEFILEYE